MATTVIHVRDMQQGDVYVGRAMENRNLRSGWGNPFKIGRDGTREQVIAKYREYIVGRTVLMRQIGELKGKRLACWCAPKACHADVLAELAEAAEDGDE